MPLELRSNIYSHFLCPKPERVLTIYHDRLGRNSYEFYPAILRVSRQIYNEAIIFLYEKNTFAIFITTEVSMQCKPRYFYRDSIPNPPALFRYEEEQDTVPNGYSSEQHNYQTPVHLEPRSTLGKSGIYPHVFQRFKNVEVIVTQAALFGSSSVGEFFSHSGYLLLQILHHLGRSFPSTISKSSSASSPNSREKRIHVTISGDDKMDNPDLFAYRSKDIQAMSGLLREAKLPAQLNELVMAGVKLGGMFKEMEWMVGRFRRVRECRALSVDRGMEVSHLSP